ncbi:MAG: hypothetical protein R3B47_12705 [Bacteroidia bacterium]
MLVVVVLFSVSCKKETAKTGNAVTIQLNTEPSSLSPFWGGDAVRNLLLQYTTQGLVMINPEDAPACAGPCSKASEVSPDGKTYHADLASKHPRPDGQALVSEDVLFSMKAALATESP